MKKSDYLLLFFWYTQNERKEAADGILVEIIQQGKWDSFCDAVNTVTLKALENKQYPYYYLREYRKQYKNLSVN